MEKRSNVGLAPHLVTVLIPWGRPGGIGQAGTVVISLDRYSYRYNFLYFKAAHTIILFQLQSSGLHTCSDLPDIKHRFWPVFYNPGIHKTTGLPSACVIRVQCKIASLRLFRVRHRHRTQLEIRAKSSFAFRRSAMSADGTLL
jgi:hypothetical protein